MAYQLTDKLIHLNPYEPISGQYPIRLDANESFVDLRSQLEKEILDAVLKVPLNRYPDPCATEVCKAFAGFYGISPKCVTAGNGSDELISVIQTAFLKKGDKVLTFTPDFSMYRFYSELVELDPLVLQKDESLLISADDIIKAANENKVSAIFFSNPCNPTSLGMKREEVRRMIQSVSALVVLDEAYMDFWDQSLLDECCRYDNLIILRTCSKALGLAAIRLGFAVASERLSRALMAAKSPYNVNALTQAIGCTVLSHPTLLKDHLSEIIKSRDGLYESLVKLSAQKNDILKVYEPRTNFVFCKMRNASNVFEQLKAQGIIVRRMGEMLRITAGTALENDSFIKAFAGCIQ